MPTAKPTLPRPKLKSAANSKRPSSEGHIESPTGQPLSNGELLKERAYEQLRRRIINGDIPPGSFLAERQLAAQFGMSKTPIKAAIDRLEHEGFLLVSPHQGIVVREMTVAEIEDHYEIRIALETYNVRTIAGRLTPLQIEELQVNLTNQQRRVGSNDVSGNVELDSGFHRMLARFTQNQEILRVMTQLQAKMQRVIKRVFENHSARMSDSCREHTEIGRLILEGQGGEAARLIQDHLQRGRQLIFAPRS